jgi:hypothetical protein
MTIKILPREYAAYLRWFGQMSDAMRNGTTRIQYPLTIEKYRRWKRNRKEKDAP